MEGAQRSGLLARLPNIFVRNILWNTALYLEGPDYQPGDPLGGAPAHLFETKRLWRTRSAIVTRADPFLWAGPDRLYIFLEAEPEAGEGRIEIWETEDLSNFNCVEVLREPYHLSYPFAFEHEGGMFLLPESSAGGGIFLYAFEDFPRRPRKRRQLLEGPYVDSSLIRVDGIWYLFTTSTEGGLEIHSSADLLEGTFQPHPANPVCTDRRFSRSGGGVLRTPTGLVRIAQDCSRGYGDNLNLLAIETLTPDAYSERVVRQDMFDRSDRWNRLGVHHLSLARFKGRTVVAIDGKQADFYIHRLRALAYRALHL